MTTNRVDGRVDGRADGGVNGAGRAGRDGTAGYRSRPTPVVRHDVVRGWDLTLPFPRSGNGRTALRRTMADGNDRAIVLFSGGQDSTTCLAWALDRFAHVETVAFDYRQRHRLELECRKQVLAEFHRLFPAWGGK